MSAATTTLPRRVAWAVGFRTPRIFPWTRYKTSATFLWLVGCLATSSLVASIMQGLPSASGQVVWNYKYLLVAAICQWQLTTLESPLWHREYNLISICILVVDGCINAGGIFFVLLRMANTPFWKALDLTFTSIGPTVPLGAALVVSFFLGGLLAAAPEIVWRWSDVETTDSAQQP